MNGRVLLTDRAWPDADIERTICADAGYELIDAHPGEDPAELGRLAAGVVGILTNWAKVTRSMIEGSPILRGITRLGVGVDNIDVAAAIERGVVVSRIPDYCVEEVSDHVLALTLGWARGVPRFDRAVRSGVWDPAAAQLRRVRDLVIGIWGAGRTGVRTAEKFVALGCSVLIDDRRPERAPAGAVAVPVTELLERSDVVSLHIPLTAATVGLVDGAALRRLRPGSLLVNTSRGGIVDVGALRAALDRGAIEAALDVLPNEPNVPDWLLGRDDVVLTPHVAFSSRQSIADLRRRATEDVVRIISGQEPAHRVSWS